MYGLITIATKLAIGYDYESDINSFILRNRETPGTVLNAFYTAGEDTLAYNTIKNIGRTLQAGWALGGPRALSYFYNQCGLQLGKTEFRTFATELNALPTSIHLDIATLALNQQVGMTKPNLLTAYQGGAFLSSGKLGKDYTRLALKFVNAYEKFINYLASVGMNEWAVQTSQLITGFPVSILDYAITGINNSLYTNLERNDIYDTSAVAPYMPYTFSDMFGIMISNLDSQTKDYITDQLNDAVIQLENLYDANEAYQDATGDSKIGLLGNVNQIKRDLFTSMDVIKSGSLAGKFLSCQSISELLQIVKTDIPAYVEDGFFGMLIDAYTSIVNEYNGVLKTWNTIKSNAQATGLFAADIIDLIENQETATADAKADVQDIVDTLTDQETEYKNNLSL